jgi:hypothetical protein
MLRVPQIAQRQFFFDEFLGAGFHPCALFGRERAQHVIQ